MVEEISHKETRPGTHSEMINVPSFNEHTSSNVGDVDALVKSAVEKYLAALPLAQLQCITVKTAADLLDCFEDTVRVYIRNGELPASKLGKDYRIRIKDLEVFLEDRKKKTLVRRLHHSRKKVS